MKNSYLILCFILCVGMVETTALPIQQLIDIQLEISYLDAKKRALKSEISSAHRYEINEETHSMQKMMSYHWSDFVSDIKGANSHEKMANDEVVELHRIEKRLNDLGVEATRLLRNSAGHIN